MRLRECRTRPARRMARPSCGSPQRNCDHIPGRGTCKSRRINHALKELRKPVQACCAAILAALVLAPGAEAAADPSCAPPGTALFAVAAPHALAQVFVLDADRVVDALEPVVGDAASGQARIQLARTVEADDGTLVPGAIVAEETVTLSPEPTAVRVALDPAPTVA